MTGETSALSEAVERLTEYAEMLPEWAPELTLKDALERSADIRTLLAALSEPQASSSLGQDGFAPGGEVEAWSYEVANMLSREGQYSGWIRRVSFTAPQVPHGSIRNLTPLYAAQPLPVPKGEDLRRLVLEFEDFINEPPRRWDVEPMHVRDYRHDAYRLWQPLARAILAQTPREAGE